MEQWRDKSIELGTGTCRKCDLVQAALGLLADFIQAYVRPRGPCYCHQVRLARDDQFRSVIEFVGVEDELIDAELRNDLLLACGPTFAGGTLYIVVFQQGDDKTVVVDALMLCYSMDNIEDGSCAELGWAVVTDDAKCRSDVEELLGVLRSTWEEHRERSDGW